MGLLKSLWARCRVTPSHGRSWVIEEILSGSERVRDRWTMLQVSENLRGGLPISYDILRSGSATSRQISLGKGALILWVAIGDT